MPCLGARHCCGFCSCYLKKKKKKSQAPVAPNCNISYSGGRDQEDLGSKPARASSSQDPISNKPITGGTAQGVGPEFKPQYCNKKKKNSYP
jgi:hypothetical protein